MNQVSIQHSLSQAKADPSLAWARFNFSFDFTNNLFRLVFLNPHLGHSCIIILQDDVEDDDMQEYFGQFGNLLSVTRMTEKETGKRRGFGFVEYDDYDSVDRVILKVAIYC